MQICISRGIHVVLHIHMYLNYKTVSGLTCNINLRYETKDAVN